MTIIVDANILIALGLADEPLHSQAEQLLAVWRAAKEQLAALHLFRSELTAVVRKAVYQHRITADSGRVMLSKLLEYPVEFYEDDELLKAAYELAVRFNRPRAYDTQYMALAERLDAEFWTADQRLVNACRATFSRIHWLGDWRPRG